MDCDFQFNESENKYICEHCGYKSKVLAKRNCGTIPSITQRATNFTKSIIQHVMHDRPKCTEEQIKERLIICKDCDLFKKNSDSTDERPVGICGHNTCGCNISDTNKFLNKLAWADQECPLKKWLKLT